MSLRARLMATFVAIILMVGLIMGGYQARLLDSFFRREATDQLVQQARSMELLIGRLSVIPPADSPVTRNLVSVASSVTSARVLVTDARGVILLDSANDQLVGQVVSATYISRTLRNGVTETFDFPVVGTDAVGAAVPWRTGAYITGTMIFIRPLATAARQSTLEAANFLIRAGLLATAVALILSYFLASNITDPLRRISQVARSISKGDFLQRVDVQSNDELGDLAQAMNSMSEEISILVDNLTQEKDKLRALAEERQNMMSDISHDLRTPVTSIRGFVEALQDGVIKDEDERLRTLGIIHDESERLSRLVEDLFYLARLEAGEIPVEMVEVDFADVVRGSMNAVGPQALEKHVELRLSADEASMSGKALVRCSADRLTRAVLNLLDNAIKYSPEGGQVEVSLKVSQTDSQVLADADSARVQRGLGATQPARTSALAEEPAQPAKPSSSSCGAVAILTVSDQGPGIPAEDIPHIFERFYRTDKSRARLRSSAGLGLSIAKFIVDQHAGRLWVQSEVGRGSTFGMALPLN